MLKSIVDEMKTYTEEMLKNSIEKSLENTRVRNMRAKNLQDNEERMAFVLKQLFLLQVFLDLDLDEKINQELLKLSDIPETSDFAETLKSMKKDEISIQVKIFIENYIENILSFSEEKK